MAAVLSQSGPRGPGGRQGQVRRRGRRDPGTWHHFYWQMSAWGRRGRVGQRRLDQTGRFEEGRVQMSRGPDARQT
eukprot:6540197-Pyramimonas_sp.AAC.1